MMSDWSLPIILEEHHKNVEQRLSSVRRSFAHPGTKGAGSENIWIDLLNTYLPDRYSAAEAHVVDSNGVFSDQIDVVIFDRQYSPFVFNFEEQIIIPAESVYAVFEAKQTMNAKMISYAQTKVSSVRQLYRTSLPIPHAGGTYPAKKLSPIIGGLLTLESDWTPGLGDSLINSLKVDDQQMNLEIGCAAAHGYFFKDTENSQVEIRLNNKATTTFLFKLLSILQSRATVPMIDIQSYAKWLE